MPIENIPETYISNAHKKETNLFTYDLKMQHDIVKAKVNLTTHIFSFLQTGEKQVNLPESSVTIDNSQSLLIKKEIVFGVNLSIKKTVTTADCYFFRKSN